MPFPQHKRLEIAASAGLAKESNVMKIVVVVKKFVRKNGDSQKCYYVGINPKLTLRLPKIDSVRIMSLFLSYRRTRDERQQQRSRQRRRRRGRRW